MLDIKQLYKLRWELETGHFIDAHKRINDLIEESENDLSV
jgi:hypothetical protein